MRIEKNFALKETNLSNNCPECYSNNGLKLTFRQKLIENLFYKTITAETSNEIHCKNCDTQIFPVRWTDDIEQVVAYKERTLELNSKSITLKPLAWIVILFNVGVILIVLFVMDIISF